MATVTCSIVSDLSAVREALQLVSGLFLEGVHERLSSELRGKLERLRLGDLPQIRELSCGPAAVTGDYVIVYGPDGDLEELATAARALKL